MRHAIEVAQQGAGFVSPNPLVGCVVVRNDDVLARGWHAKFGGPHAEADALRDIVHLDEHDVVYVTLEPCAHVGKTPPCADLLIAKGARTVVVGCRDPHPAVAGKGIERLRAAGVSVIEGIEEDSCRWLARFFLCHTQTGRPWVTVKIAQSIDGVVGAANHQQQSITNSASRTIVHRMRSHYDAVLVGSGTILSDDPQLTVRDVDGRNPNRVILDRRGRLPISSQVVRTAQSIPTIVYTSTMADTQWINALREMGVDIVNPNRVSAENLLGVLADLGQRSITSVLCESGPTLSTALFREKLVQELQIHMSPRILGEGTYWRPDGIHTTLTFKDTLQVDDDLHITYTTSEIVP